MPDSQLMFWLVLLLSDALRLTPVYSAPAASARTVTFVASATPSGPVAVSVQTVPAAMSFMASV